MKIKEIRLENFRRFSDFTIGFDEKVTVLVARNGAGKSSVLDAVAISLGAFLTRLPKVVGKSFEDTDFKVLENGGKPPFMRVTCKSYNDIKWDRTEKRDKTQKTEQQITKAIGLKSLNNYADYFIDSYNESVTGKYSLPIFIHYGTGRGVFDVPARKKGFGKEFTRFGALSGALESRTNFRRFVEYFYFLEEQENKLQKEHRSFDIELPELRAIRAAIGQFLPEFSNPRGVYPAGIMLDWNSGNAKKELRIEQLSDGYRTTLAMIMDIAARMAEANPDMPDPLQTEGVVMIDEVDLHLHPGWQQTILRDLARTFPLVQFIVSTHSPQIVSTVKPTQIRVIDWQGEKPTLMPIYFSEGAEFQQVLMDVLGVKSSRAEHLEIVKSLRKYQQYVENDQWDCKDAKKLRKELDEWAGEYESELSNLDMDISIRELDR